MSCLRLLAEISKSMGMIFPVLAVESLDSNAFRNGI